MYTTSQAHEQHEQLHQQHKQQWGQHLHSQHQSWLEQEAEQQHQHQPQMDHSGRRKRSFHFEPEFIAALDASLEEPASPFARPRPGKKPRRSTAAPTLSSTNNSINTESRLALPPKQKSTIGFVPQQISDGPSIIDLSSGEELVALNLGENEHKRRRPKATENGSSTESLREVYDVMEDGSLRPVMDHAPALPSPAKRLRTDTHQKNDIGHSSSENRNSIRRTGSTVSNLHLNGHEFKKEKSKDKYRDDQWQMGQDTWMAEDEGSIKMSPKMPRAELGALIRYEGPKSMTLADGVDALLRQRWMEPHTNAPTLHNTQGNELVLYRRPPPTLLSSQEEDDSQISSARIEELDDSDEPYVSQSWADKDDSRLDELEEGIMDMDLD